MNRAELYHDTTLDAEEPRIRFFKNLSDKDRTARLPGANIHDDIWEDALGQWWYLTDHQNRVGPYIRKGRADHALLTYSER